MHHTADATHPLIVYAWCWKTRRWSAIIGGTVVIATATTAELIVVQAWAWMEGGL